jgi:hypothetical protein
LTQPERDRHRWNRLLIDIALIQLLVNTAIRYNVIPEGFDVRPMIDFDSGLEK